MSMSDPIADMLTRIRNAQATRKVKVEGKNPRPVRLIFDVPESRRAAVKRAGKE